MKERPTIVGADYGEERSAEVFFRVNSDGSVTIVDEQQWTATIDVEPETQKTADAAQKDSAS